MTGSRTAGTAAVRAWSAGAALLGAARRVLADMEGLARVAEGLVGLVLKAGYQRQQQSHPKPACLLALANAPALKFVTVGKIGALEEISLKRLRRLPQGIG